VKRSRALPDLGGEVIKQQIARPGQGKSKGYRTIGPFPARAHPGYPSRRVSVVRFLSRASEYPAPDCYGGALRLDGLLQRALVQTQADGEIG
jgi:hypothetical protein